jgi:hypothetical protein
MLYSELQDRNKRECGYATLHALIADHTDQCEACDVTKASPFCHAVTVAHSKHAKLTTHSFNCGTPGSHSFLIQNMKMFRCLILVQTSALPEGLTTHSR